MRLLVVTAVEAEARAVGAHPQVRVIAGGIGRTNAAAAVTEALVRDGACDAVLSVGIAGALPGSGLALGEVVVASSCVYVEEGLATPAGFLDMEAMGFPLGDFRGNVVPVDERLLVCLRGRFRAVPIATVATCSGTDAAAAEVVRRTGAAAEAMEGAAVVHAARRLKVPAIEVRAISNTTGDRARQRWSMGEALAALGPAMAQVIDALSGQAAERRRS